MKQGSQYLSLMVVLAIGLLSTGCAGGWLATHGPWASSKEDKVPGIKTADKRIEELKELAVKGPKQPPAEQQQVSERLARQIERETDPLVREQILLTLAVYPTALAGKVLQAALNDNETDVRIICCQALATRGGPESIENLCQALNNDASIDVKLAAIRALGKLKDPKAVPALADSLAGADPAMQNRAIQSLKSVSGKDYGMDIGAWQQYAKSGQEPKTQIADKSWWRKLF